MSSYKQCIQLHDQLSQLSFPSMQIEVFAFVTLQILTSLSPSFCFSAGEKYLFIYGGRSAVQPVLGDWYFLHTPEISCTVVRT